MVCPEEVNSLTEMLLVVAHSLSLVQVCGQLGWALLSNRIATVLSGLKVFINADFKDFRIS